MTSYTKKRARFFLTQATSVNWLAGLNIEEYHPPPIAPRINRLIFREMGVGSFGNHSAKKQDKTIPYKITSKISMLNY